MDQNFDDLSITTFMSTFALTLLLTLKIDWFIYFKSMGREFELCWRSKLIDLFILNQQEGNLNLKLLSIGKKKELGGVLFFFLCHIPCLTTNESWNGAYSWLYHNAFTLQMNSMCLCDVCKSHPNRRGHKLQPSFTLPSTNNTVISCNHGSKQVFLSTRR